MSERRSQGWFEIKEGLRLDSCGQDEDAFRKYLEGVQKLCSYIKDETTLSELQRDNSARVSILKILSTMKESLTRVENIISKPDKNGQESKPDLLQLAGPRKNCSSSLPVSLSQNKPKEMNRPLPLEIAEKQNIHLWRNYEKRFRNIKDSSQRVTMSLELERRIQENLSLAREKASKYWLEQAKIESEALHLAASKLANSCLPNETVNDPQTWSNKVALCACVLRYKSEEESWIQAFPKKFRENQSQAIVTQAIRRILRSVNHPLTTWLYGKQANVKDRVSSVLSQQLAHDSRMTEFVNGEVNRKGMDLLSMFDPVQNLGENVLEPQCAMKEVAQEITSILETFLQIFGVSLELTDSGDYVDGCYPVLEQAFFHDLWPTIIKLYRYIYRHEEAVLSSVCQKFKSGTDSDVNISDLLSLPAQNLDAIFVDLQHFLSNLSPLMKVNSLVEITHILCENDSTLKYEKILSADDLIGLVSCLLVQSNMPHLLPEFEALEQFIPHRFLMGEEGYSLTTFLTSMRYLESQGEAWKETAALSC